MRPPLCRQSSALAGRGNHELRELFTQPVCAGHTGWNRQATAPGQDKDILYQRDLADPPATLSGFASSSLIGPSFGELGTEQHSPRYLADFVWPGEDSNSLDVAPAQNGPQTRTSRTACCPKAFGCGGRRVGGVVTGGQIPEVPGKRAGNSGFPASASTVAWNSPSSETNSVRRDIAEPLRVKRRLDRLQAGGLSAFCGEPGNTALEEKPRLLEVEPVRVGGDEGAHACGELRDDCVRRHPQDDGARALGDPQNSEAFQRLQRLADDRTRDTEYERELAFREQSRIDGKFSRLDGAQRLLTDALVKPSSRITADNCSPRGAVVILTITAIARIVSSY